LADRYFPDVSFRLPNADLAIFHWLKLTIPVSPRAASARLISHPLYQLTISLDLIVTAHRRD
jgi:hypothetical protein